MLRNEQNIPEHVGFMRCWDAVASQIFVNNISLFRIYKQKKFSRNLVENRLRDGAVNNIMNIMPSGLLTLTALLVLIVSFLHKFLGLTSCKKTPNQMNSLMT